MKTETTYVIRTAQNKMIECHDEASKQHASDMVAAHNKFNPNNQWKLCVEQI